MTICPRCNGNGAFYDDFGAPLICSCMIDKHKYRYDPLRDKIEAILLKYTYKGEIDLKMVGSLRLSLEIMDAINERKT